jgi:hypothetical protein
MIPVVLRASGSTPVAPLVFFIAMLLAWSFSLLRALRWPWIATVVDSALGLALDLATETGFGTWTSPGFDGT